MSDSHTCWFIERENEPRWFAGLSASDAIWTNDPHHAARFCREGDALLVCIDDVLGQPAAPTEHGFEDESDDSIPLSDQDVDDIMEYVRSRGGSGGMGVAR
jgi:hypothetical protein